MPVWFLDDADRWHSLDDVAITVSGESLGRFATVRTMDRAGKDTTGQPVPLTGGA